MPLLNEYFGYPKEQEQKDKTDESEVKNRKTQLAKDKFFQTPQESLSSSDATLRNILSEQNEKMLQLEKMIKALKIDLAAITKLLNEHGISAQNATSSPDATSFVRSGEAALDSEKEDQEVTLSPIF